MFKRDPNDKRRVIIVDFSHMAWSYAFGQATGLTSTLTVNGVPQTVDTTIPAYTIKTLHRWSEGGKNPLAVCFDSAGSSRCRKAYFSTQTDGTEGSKPAGYKARRESQDARFYNGIALTMNLLMQGGVSVYAAEGYEADDLVKACVDKAKVDYPNLPIEVVTGDHDLLPLVDEQVSVFLRSVKSTWAQTKEREKKHYVQITPDNYQEYLESLTAYKNLSVPYNTVLLAKLLRGDKSDEIPGKPDWKPKMYKRLIEILQERRVDLSNLFRYDSPTQTIVYKGTTTPIPADLVASTPKEEKALIFGEPPALTRICETLAPLVEPADIDHIRYVYNGINLNGAFTNLGTFNRRPATITTPIKGYVDIALQTAVAKFKINLYVR
ncbi:hypothetical protein [Ruminococcus sp.]|uniref:hypothetical protein n=1 Tax=Ruminococcus sp. TaxID=41978 RepID=UPI0039673DE1